MRVWQILFLALTLTGPVRALDLQLPGSSTLSSEVLRDPDFYLLPVGPFAAGKLPTTEVEGRVLQQAWRIEQQGVTTLQMIRPLRAQLTDAGYDIIYECGGQQCGGFDFRFNTRVMAAPDMYIDLFDYRYLAAIKGDKYAPGGIEYLSVIVSRTGAAGYLQIIHVATDGADTLKIDPGSQTVQAVTHTDTPLIQRLTEQGHVILKDLDFTTGSSTLGNGPHASLRTLASFLKSDRSRRIALVGHTDTVGTLENNIALSRRRAASVLERLVADYDVPRSQLDAEGMGYLSPIGPNLTPEGREANRRVEAVLLNTK